MKTALTLTMLAVLAGALLYLATGFPYGQPRTADMDDYFIRHGQEQCGANNIVTAVVFDYRGFDTLGEATVLFTAVLGVGVMFRKRFAGEDYEND